jgi:hypothetical protein
MKWAKESGVVAHTYKCSTGEAKAGLAYIVKPCLIKGREGRGR